MNISDFMDISLEETKKNALPRVLATSSRDIVEEYMMVTPHLCREVEGRLIVVD
jgi:5'-nucleotidase